MSEPGWAGFIAETRDEESPAQQAARLARQGSERQERAELAAEIAAAAAAEEAREARLFRYAQLGIGGRDAGDVFADAGRLGDEDAEYEAARSVMEKIERRRASRAKVQRYQAEQVEAVSRAAAGPADLLAPAKAAHREYVQASRAAQAAAQAGTPRRGRRPFASRGAAVRSEQCIHCIDQGVSDENSYLLHSDPELNVPVTPPGRNREAEKAEADRLMGLGFSADTARLAAIPFGAGMAVR